ncbi:MAG: hypothetical protein GF417_03780 [Candidatus Latescibacteria bacterium]|nr:hypothetical protein [bacterium]MBD3423545.1 hypothetical protein [Candidatus Latescibacterota bacterium]
MIKRKLLAAYVMILFALAASPAGAGGLSAGLKYGHSILLADYADPGSAVSADLSCDFNQLTGAGFQFSYNIYQPLPACEIFGGDCRWEREGDFRVSEYFVFMRLSSPHLVIIPASAFIILGPCWFNIDQDIVYTSGLGASPQRRTIRRDIDRIGFIAGGGFIFDDFRGFSIEFAPVLKVLDDMDNHLDIYMGVRYEFN